MKDSNIALVILVCIFFIIAYQCVLADQEAASRLQLHKSDCPMLKRSYVIDTSDPAQMHQLIVDTINHEDDLHRFTKSKTKSLLLKSRDAVIAGLLAALVSKGEFPEWREGVQWAVTAGIALGIAEFVAPWGDGFDHNSKMYI